MFQIETLGQVSLAVADVAAATTFYRDQVGLKFLFAAGPNFSFFSLGATRLMISGTENGEPAPGNSTFYFKVESLDTVFEELRENLTFLDKPHLIAKMPDHELWMVFFTDPEENLMAFMEERPLP